MAHVSIDQLVAELDLEVRSRGNESSAIRNPRIQKPGLALTGYETQLDKGRLLAFGGTEIAYLSHAEPAQVELATRTVLASEPACIVITRGLEPPPELLAACEVVGVPLLVSQEVSSVFISRVKRYLVEQLAPVTTIHGVLVFVHGLGVLIKGKSGVGKSEAAIDLVLRGHRLVADDMVVARRLGPSTVVGSGPPMLGTHMEIRGLGVIDVAALFGVAAVRDSSKIELILELVAWDGGHDQHDRVGIDREVCTILGEELPLRRVPVKPGRNMATIIEVAALDHLLRLTGRNSAAELAENLSVELARRRQAFLDEAEETS